MSITPVLMNNALNESSLLGLDSKSSIDGDLVLGSKHLKVSGFKDAAASANGLYQLSDIKKGCSPIYIKPGENSSFSFSSFSDFSNLNNLSFFNESQYFPLGDEAAAFTNNSIDLIFHPDSHNTFLSFFSDFMSYQDRDKNYINLDSTTISIEFDISSERSSTYDVGICLRQFDNYFAIPFEEITISSEKSSHTIEKAYSSSDIINVFSNYDAGDLMKDLNLIDDGSTFIELGIYIKSKSDASEKLFIHDFSLSIFNSTSPSFYIFENEDKLILSSSLEEPSSANFIYSNEAFRKKFHGLETIDLISVSSEEDFFYQGRPDSYFFHGKWGSSSFFYNQQATCKIIRFEETEINPLRRAYWDMDLDDQPGQEDFDEFNLHLQNSSAINFNTDVPLDSKHFYLDIEGHMFTVDTSLVSSINIGLTLLCREVNSLYTLTGIWSFFYLGRMVFLRPRGGATPVAKLHIGTQEPDPGSSGKRLSTHFPMLSINYPIEASAFSYSQISYVFK